MNSSNHSGEYRKQSSESQMSSLLLFLFRAFEGDPHQSPGASHSLRSLGGLVGDISCMSMLTTNCYQNWWITLEQQEVRKCPFCPIDHRFRSQTKTCASSWVCTSSWAVSEYHFWGSWTFAKCPFHLSLSLFCASCALMHLNRLQIVAPLDFSKWVPALPLLQYENKTKLCRHF